MKTPDQGIAVVKGHDLEICHALQLGRAIRETISNWKFQNKWLEELTIP